MNKRNKIKFWLVFISEQQDERENEPEHFQYIEAFSMSLYSTPTSAFSLNVHNRPVIAKFHVPLCLFDLSLDI